MTDQSDLPTGAEEDAVIATIVKAATCGLDFGGWLAGILAAAAAQMGSTEALLASRPGSWEAAAIREFLHSTVGYDDEDLNTYRREPAQVAVPKRPRRAIHAGAVRCLSRCRCGSLYAPGAGHAWRHDA